MLSRPSPHNDHPSPQECVSKIAFVQLLQHTHLLDPARAKKLQLCSPRGCCLGWRRAREAATAAYVPPRWPAEAAAEGLLLNTSNVSTSLWLAGEASHWLEGGDVVLFAYTSRCFSACVHAASHISASSTCSRPNALCSKATCSTQQLCLVTYYWWIVAHCS
jgi:hypothetical protein